jgi:hypothetical protein
MDLNKKLIDQLSDLSRNIKSLTSEVKENKNVVSAENSNSQKEGSKEESGKKESIEDQNKKFLKSLEDIFKKGVGEITKKNSEIPSTTNTPTTPKGKGLESALSAISPLKDKALESIVSSPKTPKGVSGLLGKIPKFASGGVMDKTGLALVGEKGPEVVKLNKGSEVISNDKTSELLKKEKAPNKTADQLISPEKGATSEQIEKYRKWLLSNDTDDYYKRYPDEMPSDIELFVRRNRYHTPDVIDRLMEGMMEEEQTFTQEDVAKLSQPVNKTSEIKQEPEEISKRDQRKKEKEEKRKAKEENKKAEDLLKPEIKEQEGEKSSLLDKGKSFLKEKGIGEKGKNLLFTKGKDILTGKTSLKDIAKNPASLLGDKSQLLGKGMGAATSLLSNKGLREKATDKLKGLKKEEEKPTMSSETPELKKIQPKEVKSEEVNTTPKKEETPKEKTPEKKENIKSEGSSPEKSGSTNTPKESSGGKSESIGVTDLDEIKSLLGKMVSLLEGPLSIETMESPFRPDSRRF